MKARRGAALGLAIASSAALAVAVPFAVADKGGDKHQPKTPVAGTTAPPPSVLAPATRGLLEASLTQSSRGKSNHDRGHGGKKVSGSGIATIAVKDNQLCYAIVTVGLDALQSAEIDWRKGGIKLLDLPINVGAIGDPNAVANCIALNAQGQYVPATGGAGVDVAKLVRKPEKFVVTVKTTTTSVSGKLHRVSRHS